MIGCPFDTNDLISFLFKDISYFSMLGFLINSASNNTMKIGEFFHRSKKKDLVKIGSVLVVATCIWTMDIHQSSSVVDLLARVAGVPGLILGPTIYFQCTNMLIPPFILL